VVEVLVDIFEVLVVSVEVEWEVLVVIKEGR
jgi:hypothetical protein